MSAPTRALKNLFLFQSIPGQKMQQSKTFKLKILICFNLPITEHWTPLHQTPHISSIPLSNRAIFMMLEVLSEGLQMFFELQMQRNNVWVLKCSLTSLSTTLFLFGVRTYKSL
jgi:hypothetical protein